MKRAEIRRILREHRGAQADAAARADVYPGDVSKWLRGRHASKNVAQCCEAVALEILAGTWKPLEQRRAA
jgi:hypothetical protein